LLKPIMFHRKWGVSLVASVVLVILGLLPHSRDVQSQGPRFQLEEATIPDVHRAIRERQITCRALVQAYVNRARAYNGVSDRLVTPDGAPIPVARGTVRILSVASAYEAASKRRVPPPAYPRLPPRS